MISCSTDCSFYPAETIQNRDNSNIYIVYLFENLVQMHTSSRLTLLMGVLLVLDINQASVETTRLGQQGVETIWCFQ